MIKQDFTGWIIGKETRKVYRKNEFYGNINYQITVLKEEDQQKLTFFVYANLVNQEIIHLLEQGQYINKRYYFFYQRKNKNLVLTDLQEINHVQKT